VASELTENTAEDNDRLRVLLIEHDPKMISLVRSILTDDGYEVVGMTTADDALSQLAELDPDVIVLDEVMPDVEGLEVAEEIRERRGEQPIVIFSSLFDRRLGQESKRRGYVYCEKADGIERLEACILQAYRRTD
jgi:two-component system, OmpR family, response regulator VicR